MNVALPPYMKNILKCCGYDNCHTIATIEDADVEYITDEVRKGSVNKFYHGAENADAIMKGCATSVENFVFSRGHVRLLQKIVKVVKETLEKHGADGFSLELPTVSSEVTSKVNEKESKAASFYRKRFKFSALPSTPAQESNDELSEAASDYLNDDATTSAIRNARSLITSKAILILITRTPDLFANVGIYFDSN